MHHRKAARSKTLAGRSSWWWNWPWKSRIYILPVTNQPYDDNEKIEFGFIYTRNRIQVQIAKKWFWKCIYHMIEPRPGSKRGQRSSSNQFLWSISINRVSSVLYWWKTVLKFISDWLKIQRNFQKFLNFRAPVSNWNRSEWNWTWGPRTIPGLVTLSEDGPRWPYPNFIGSFRSGSIFTVQKSLILKLTWVVLQAGLSICLVL